MRLLLALALVTVAGCPADDATPVDAGSTGDGTDVADATDDTADDVADTDAPADVDEDTGPSEEVAETDDAPAPDAPEPDAEPDVAEVTDPDTAEPLPPWAVVDGVIHHDGVPTTIRGVNWFGMETADNAPHGLWTDRTVEDFVGQVAELGFNALRLPVTPGAIRPGFDTADWAKSKGLATGREALEAVLAETRKIGLWVLLDYHSCNDDHGTDQVGVPDGCEGATIEQWHDDLKTLAELGLEYPNVLGIDLFNEPWGLTWSEWAVLAADASAAILETNPDLLLFVQGVANESDSAGYTAFWGGNLAEGDTIVPDIPADRMVYSPHVYGPSVAAMDYFAANDYPLNLPKVWQAHFAHLHSAGYAVITGEFGSRYDEAEVPGSVAWQDAWITFMVETGQTDFFYWALNANTGAITGILQDDWLTPDPNIMQSLTPLFEDY